MHVWCLVVGIILLSLCVYDIVWTTLSASETGSLTLCIVRFYKWTAHIFRRYKLIHRILRSIGILTFMTSLFVWYLLLWFSFGLIFASVEESIVRASDNGATDYYEKFYFAGYIVFTSGLGDYKPNNTEFRMVTIISNCLGLFLVAITVSYVVSATDAVTKHRHLAARIGGLGNCPIDIISNSWNGTDLKSLEHTMSGIAKDISLCAQLFRRFPIIFNFHNLEMMYTPAVQLTVIDEVLTIMQCCFIENVRVSKLNALQVRTALNSYFDSLQIIGIRNAENVSIPEMPDLTQISDIGIPMFPRNVCYMNFNNEAIKERRRLLHFIINENTRKWNDTKCSRCSCLLD